MSLFKITKDQTGNITSNKIFSASDYDFGYVTSNKSDNNSRYYAFVEDTTSQATLHFFDENYNEVKSNNLPVGIFNDSDIGEKIIFTDGEINDGHTLIVKSSPNTKGFDLSELSNAYVFKNSDFSQISEIPLYKIFGAIKNSTGYDLSYFNDFDPYSPFPFNFELRSFGEDSGFNLKSSPEYYNFNNYDFGETGNVCFGADGSFNVEDLKKIGDNRIGGTSFTPSLSGNYFEIRFFDADGSKVAISACAVDSPDEMVIFETNVVTWEDEDNVGDFSNYSSLYYETKFPWGNSFTYEYISGKGGPLPLYFYIGAPLGKGEPTDYPELPKEIVIKAIDLSTGDELEVLEYVPSSGSGSYGSGSGSYGSGSGSYGSGSGSYK